MEKLGVQWTPSFLNRWCEGWVLWLFTDGSVAVVASSLDF